MIASYFQNPALLGGAVMIAAPILIHLLHRMRFKRVAWAAMEFLLESERRNRRRVFLEQLLLLLLRCALVALIVIVVARPILGERLGAALGTGLDAEHVVVFDDSYSMGQPLGPETAFTTARATIVRLAEELSRRPGVHRLTVLPLSTATKPEIASARLGADELESVQATIADVPITYLSTAPATGLAEALRRFEAVDAPNKILHFASDFRKKDWAKDGDAPARLRELSAAGVRIRLLDMASAPAGNVTLERIRAQLSSVVANVPFRVEAEVRNQGLDPVERLLVTPVVDGKPLPSQLIERVDPGKAASASFDIRLDAGAHEVALTLPSDALPQDNRRFLAALVRPLAPILIIDGGEQRRDSFYLASALEPGAGITGIDPTVLGPEALTRGGLENFVAIYLLNVPSLKPAAIEALERYVREGGGLAIFLGEQVNAADYNATLYKEGKGLLPARLGAPTALDEADAETVDVRPLPHPLTRVFDDEGSVFLNLWKVHKRFLLDGDGKLPADAKPIFQLRDGTPLAIETTRGAGKVVLFLTSAGVDWTNWPVENPSFNVCMLELQGHLAEPIAGAPEHRVGEPWVLRFDASAFRRRLTITPPANPLDANESAGPEVLEAALQGAQAELTYAKTGAPGVYRCVMKTASDESQSLVRAYNVDPAEGALEKITPAELAERLEGIEYEYHSAEEFQSAMEDTGFEPRDALLLAFAALLVAEQLLAWRLSYHVA